VAAPVPSPPDDLSLLIDLPLEVAQITRIAPVIAEVGDLPAGGPIPEDQVGSFLPDQRARRTNPGDRHTGSETGETQHAGRRGMS